MMRGWGYILLGAMIWIVLMHFLAGGGPLLYALLIPTLIFVSLTSFIYGGIREEAEFALYQLSDVILLGYLGAVVFIGICAYFAIGQVLKDSEIPDPNKRIGMFILGSLLIYCGFIAPHLLYVLVTDYPGAN